MATVFAPSAAARRRARSSSSTIWWLAGTLAQATDAGLQGALTGPVVRGDSKTVAEHLRVLDREAPAGAGVHRLLSARLLALAEKGGLRLAPADKRRLLRLLSSAGGGRRGGPTV